MNGLGKPFRKKPIQKIQKTVKISEIAACEQKSTTEKPNFCSNTVFSLNFKIRAKEIHAAKPLAFSLHFLFRRDQIHYSNLTSKIMKMCEQILKKRQRPNTIQILWIVKKPRAPQYSYAQLTASQILKKIYKSETIKSQYLIVKNHDETKTVNSIAAPDCSTS